MSLFKFLVDILYNRSQTSFPLHLIIGIQCILHTINGIFFDCLKQIMINFLRFKGEFFFSNLFLHIRNKRHHFFALFMCFHNCFEHRVKGRNIFENISQMVDEIFNSYIRRTGFVEPLAAKFCNGTTTTCDGLSQWGSQAMAEQGADSVTILRNYYGDNIEIVNNAPVMGIRSSYPGTPVRLGDRGEPVVRIQTMLNRISRDYPAIPKVQPVDGIFGASTEQSVIKFQQIFSLTPDGVVGNATWYKLVFLYVGVLELAELVSEGQTFYTTLVPVNRPDTISLGDTGENVKVIQYLLSVVAEFYNNIPPVAVDGIFGQSTQNAVLALQQMAGLYQDGVVGEDTWAALYRFYVGIVDTMSQYTNVIPEQFRPELPESEATSLTQYPGQPMTLGSTDERGEDAT